jgi:hypothetical protein
VAWQACDAFHIVNQENEGVIPRAADDVFDHALKRIHRISNCRFGDALIRQRGEIVGQGERLRCGARQITPEIEGAMALRSAEIGVGTRIDVGKTNRAASASVQIGRLDVELRR